MTTQTTIKETPFNKTIQYTNSGNGSIMTYCVNFRKELHMSFENGFRWVQC